MSANDMKVEPAHQSQPALREPRQVFSPAADIVEMNDGYRIVLDMPGIDDKSVDVTIENNVLAVRGAIEPVQVPMGKLVYEENPSGDYRRTFTLSNEIERNRIAAHVRNGVVTVHLPKAEQAKPRKIEVKAG